MKQQIEQLKEQYEQRIKTAFGLIDEVTAKSQTDDDRATVLRCTIKIGCFRLVVTELERILNTAQTPGQVGGSEKETK